MSTKNFSSFENLVNLFTNLGNVLRGKPTVIRISKADYDELTSEEKHDTTKAYYIYDYETGGVTVIDDTITALDSTWSSTKLSGLFGLKVDKISGKQLSDNNYSNTDKAIVDGVTSGLAGKVDKVTGKGLSTEDYTTEEKDKLAGIDLEDYGEVVRLTAAQYNALSNEQKHDTTKLYFIYDSNYMG